MAVGSKLVGIATGVVVRKVSDKALSAVWRKTKRSEPPADPAAPGTPWGEAISWAVASGVAMAVARLAATRGTATAKMKITGKAPEGLEGPGGKRKRA
ncbi:MAG: DUF4235 domain-containing protein [Actinobacteria bacterium]|nr:DUF4235 domain-containing protein [Actinomycetota bacterium]MCA1719713.1 DUF4235 domain-containing protein [Actinomycetota bacterium]